MYHWLRGQGYPWNHKRVYRVYCELGLNLRIKPKKRLPSRSKQVLELPAKPNVCWSMDFMSDALSSGRRFRTFNVIDDFNREALWIEIDTSLPTQRVVRTLQQIADWRGLPRRLRSDNGPELISSTLAAWAEHHRIELVFIQPGKPSQNAYIERFNRTYREDVLDMYLFSSLAEVRSITEDWLDDYNRQRPHDALGGLTPYQFYCRYVNSEVSFSLVLILGS